MSVLALGGTWLLGRRPVGPRELLVDALELGFGGVVPAPTPATWPWASLRPLLAELPAEVPAIRVEPLSEGSGGRLASSNESDWQPAFERVARAAELGRHLAVPRLILEAPRVDVPGLESSEFDLGILGTRPSREDYAAVQEAISKHESRLLDSACRALHTLATQFSEFQILLTEAPCLCALSTGRQLELILDELQSVKIGYWHHPALVGRRHELGGEAAGEILESLDKYFLGSDLADFDSLGIRALPGSGGVDYALLSPYIRGLRRRCPAVLEAGPELPESGLRQAVSYLKKFGLQAPSGS